jgi:hypothetical protein
MACRKRCQQVGRWPLCKICAAAAERAKACIGCGDPNPTARYAWQRVCERCCAHMLRDGFYAKTTHIPRTTHAHGQRRTYREHEV